MLCIFISPLRWDTSGRRPLGPNLCDVVLLILKSWFFVCTTWQRLAGIEIMCYKAKGTQLHYDSIHFWLLKLSLINRQRQVHRNQSTHHKSFGVTWVKMFHSSHQQRPKVILSPYNERTLTHTVKHTHTMHLFKAPSRCSCASAVNSVPLSTNFSSSSLPACEVLSNPGSTVYFRIGPQNPFQL